jgi:PAS domain S-box-containing protein
LRALTRARDFGYNPQAETRSTRKIKMSPSSTQQTDPARDSFQQVDSALLLDLSFDAIFVRGPEDRITYWSRGATETYGYSEEEALGRTPNELLHTESSVPAEQIIKTLYEQGRWSGELTHTRKDGSKVVVSSRWSLQKDLSGVPEAIMETNRDITEYKNTLSALTEAQSMLRQHLAHTPLAVIEWGADFRLSGWSGEAERMFGWRAEEVLGKRIEDLRWVYEEDHNGVKEISSGLLHGTRPQCKSLNRNYRKDGSIIYCEWYNSSIVNSSGTLVSILSLVLDVTEREKAREALGFVERAALFGTWDWQRDAHKLTWSEGSYSLFEYKAGEPVTYEMWRSRIDPIDVERVERDIQNAVDAAVPYDVEYRLRLPSGQRRWINSRGEVLEYSGGKAVRMAGVNYDVTARCQAEEQLWMTLESIGDGFFACDRNWNFVYINRSAEELLGINRTTMLGRNHWQVFPLALGTALEEEYRRAAAGEPRDFENFYEPWGRWFHNRCFPREGGGMSVYFQDITERKRAQRELRESEERLSLVLHASGIGFWDWNIKTGELKWSPQCMEMFGVAPGTEMTYGTFLNAVHPDDRNSVDAAVRSCLEHRREFNCEMRTAGSNGIVHWVNSVGRAYFDEEGKPTRMSGVAINITARKKAEEDLRAREETFRTLANAIPQLCWMANPDGWVFWYNERWYEYTGTSPEEMEGWGWQRVHDPAELPAILSKWQEALRRGESIEFTFPLRGRDGNFRYFLTRAYPLKDCSGNVVRWFGTNTDITQQRETEKAFRESEERFRALVSATSYAVYRMDQNWTEMLSLVGGGFISDTLEPSKSWLERYIPAEDQQSVREAIQRAVESKGLFELEHRVKRVDGSFGWTLSRAVPIFDESGEIREWFGAASDVTAKKRAEEALIRTEKLASAGRMAATVAHEINNPLEAVTNLLFLANNSPDCPLKVREYLETADSELKRVSHITRQVLGFYRDSGAPKKVSVSTVMDEAVELFLHKIANKQIHFQKEYAPHTETVVVSGELRQVFSNLLANSLDATNPGGWIKVRVSRCFDDTAVRVTIGDDGGGIPKDVLSNIFEPFFTTKGTIGTGLGLWVTRQLVEKYGGKIRVRSRTYAPRRGTTFTIIFPAA